MVEIGIVGYDLSAVPYGGQTGFGEVTGHWNDTINFTIPLGNSEAYPFIVLYDGVIPPECSNKPESDLSGDCKVNFVDFSKIASEWLHDGNE